jgi:PAS domain S-box-containing protein
MGKKSPFTHLGDRGGGVLRRSKPVSLRQDAGTRELTTRAGPVAIAAAAAGPSVLVLDDRATDRELLATVLSHGGYAVHEAATAGEALELAQAEQPDLIITDLLMREVNGYEFVRTLRADSTIGETPVVFCTANYDELEVRRLADACGVSHVMRKPCEPAEILQLVSTVLGSDLEVPSPLTAKQFDREQLRVLNEKLFEKVNELEQLQAHLLEAQVKNAESLTLLETLQSSAPIGFGFIDRDFRIVRMNETLAAVNGLPKEQQLGRTVGEVVPLLWPQIEPLYRHILETGEPVVNQEVTGEVPWAPGEIRFWLASYYPVRVNAEVIGIGTIVVDITERKQAEDFRSVVMDNMAEGLYVADAEGRLTFMNAAASKMLGWTEKELHGKPIHDVLHGPQADDPVFPEGDSEWVKARTEGRTVRVIDGAFTRKDGSSLPIACSAAPLLAGETVRGMVVVFRDTTEENAERDRARRELDALTWVGRVREALDEERFVLYSQPIVPIRAGKGSEELLLRMVGRDGEITPPGAFLPVAEKYGLIGEIDRWVVGQAARIAASGRRVEANLSAQSIGNLDLLSLIEQEMTAAGTDPSDLVFEITETALMGDIEAGEAFARGLAELGCSLALDDFGTGFGSFTYLKKLPIKYLKIDIEFVRELSSDRANQHLVKATIGLARDFGYQTIAEGVENRETLDLLEDIGVDYAQGFYLGRPIPIEF